MELPLARRIAAFGAHMTPISYTHRLAWHQEEASMFARGGQARKVPNEQAA